MQFCSQCGTAISTQAKFCPSCGLEITSGNSVSDLLEKPVQKMDKGVSKSLQEQSQQFVQQQVQEQIQGITKSSDFAEEKQPVNAIKQKEIPQQLQEKSQTQNNISFWFWIYIVLNIALAYFAYHIDEVLIVLMLSFLTVITVLIRKDKPNPFNWLVKLFLLAQTAIYIFLEKRWLDYMFQIRVSQIIIALFLINFILLFKGNRNK